MTLSIISVTDDAGNITDETWLVRAEAVHRQLHNKFPDGTGAYLALLRKVFESGGRMCLAVEEEQVKAVAIWRIIYNTLEKKRLHIDDIVTDAPCRSVGVGRILILWLEALAREMNCTEIALDSGVQRDFAHRFYYRRGFAIKSFYFRKEFLLQTQPKSSL
jgi:GNAT superfamily N-acetyltransferase